MFVQSVRRRTASVAAAIQPERVDYNGLPAWYMSMASLVVFGQPDNSALEQLYLITPSGDYFGVATHADNWLTSPDPIIAWFDFLQEQDSDGRSMRILSQILSELSILEQQANAGWVDLQTQIGAVYLFRRRCKDHRLNNFPIFTNALMLRCWLIDGCSRRRFSRSLAVVNCRLYRPYRAEFA